MEMKITKKVLTECKKCKTVYDCQKTAKEENKYFLWRDKASFFDTNLTCTECLRFNEFFLTENYCGPVDWASYNPQGDYEEIYFTSLETSYPFKQVISELVDIMDKHQIKINFISEHLEPKECSRQDLLKLIS